MPLYEWCCPGCKRVTTVIRPMAEYNVPPEKCNPEPAERKDLPTVDGKPQYERFESCGHASQEIEAEDGTKPGWKKLIGSTRFILQGYGWFRDGYM